MTIKLFIKFSIQFLIGILIIANQTPSTVLAEYNFILNQSTHSNNDETYAQDTGTTNFVYLPFVTNGKEAFYVAVNGNDANPGTVDRPWRTIGKAARVAYPGMLVYIRGGVYHEVVEARISGTESQPIQFMAYPGEKPIIDGYGQLPTYWVGLFSMVGDWIQVSGIETRNSKYDGFGAYGRHDLINNVSAHDNRYKGILLKGDYGTVQNSRAWRNSLINENGGSSVWSGGISAALDLNDGITDFAVIRNNEVWENYGEGISAFNAKNTLIEGNTVYDNWSANIYVSDATYIQVKRNFVYSTGLLGNGTQVGIMMGDEQYNPPSANISVINNIVYGTNQNFYWWPGVQGGGMKNVVILNNTFVNSSATACVKILPGTHQNVSFKNNIVVQNDSLPVIQIFQSSTELHFSNNLWSKTPSTIASGPGDIIDDPKFTEAGDPFSPNWFELSNLSPAINHGAFLTEVSIDYFGNSRDSILDIGAIEYISIP
jgi:parallel beta-helix repeat protein